MLIVAHTSLEMSLEAVLVEKLALPGGFPSGTFFSFWPLYEPLSSISLKWLTLKTFFLVFVASGRRGSEAHTFSAMDQGIAFEPDGSISLRFLPEFLAQNQQPGTTSSVVFIRLSSLLAPDDEDNYLCPVRALRRYLLVNRARRNAGLRRLFISLNLGYNADIRAPTLARWVSEVVVKGYATRDLVAPSHIPSPFSLSSRLLTGAQRGLSSTST